MSSPHGLWANRALERFFPARVVIRHPPLPLLPGASQNISCELIAKGPVHRPLDSRPFFFLFFIPLVSGHCPAETHTREQQLGLGSLDESRFYGGQSVPAPFINSPFHFMAWQGFRTRVNFRSAHPAVFPSVN